MFKKLFLVGIIYSVSASCAWAYNAQFEHEKYRQQLNVSAARQRAENQSYIRYYKGKPDSSYAVFGTGASSYYGKNNIYAKKGVQFKVDTAPKKVEKEPEDNNVSEDKQQNNTSVQSSKAAQSASSTTMTKASTAKTTVTTNTKTTGAGHNADAE